MVLGSVAQQHSICICQLWPFLYSPIKEFPGPITPLTPNPHIYGSGWQSGKKRLLRMPSSDLLFHLLKPEQDFMKHLLQRSKLLHLVALKHVLVIAVSLVQYQHETKACLQKFIEF